jgi:hypothetical protein
MKKQLNLSESELRLADADDAGEATGDSLYLAFCLKGVRVEIEGSAATAMALAAAVCRAGYNLEIDDHD